jgi:fructokinase
MAQLDESGSADYRFYFESTSAAALVADDLPAGLLEGCRALALGGLGIVFEPVRSTLLQAVAQAPSDLLVLLDPNCRPRAIEDVAGYRRTVSGLVSRADIIKVSVEDLQFLSPGCAPVEYATGLIARGPAVVLITDGAHPTRLVTGEGVLAVEVPPVEVSDTIGAGDAFVAGLLAWLERHPDVDPRAGELEVLEAAVQAAAEVSAAVVGSRGAALAEGFVWTRGGQARSS